MSSESDDNHTTRYSSEHYDIVGANLDWFIILATACTIFFGFLLKIVVNPPSYFKLFDDAILLTALYTVTVATGYVHMYPIIYHVSNYRRLDVDRFLSRSKWHIMIGIICVMLAVYLVLGLLLNSKLPVLIAYSLPSLPFIFILFRFRRHFHA